MTHNNNTEIGWLIDTIYMATDSVLQEIRFSKIVTLGDFQTHHAELS